MDVKRLRDYIVATVSLYGIVPYEQVAKLYSEQNEESISREDIVKLLDDPYAGSLLRADCQKGFAYEYKDAFFVGEWILEFDAFDEHWFAQQGKPYYEPGKEELLKWSDPHYFDRPEESYELERFIKKSFESLDSEKAEGIAEDLQMMADDPFSADRVFKEFDRHGLVFEGEQQAREVLDLVVKAHNHTRIQANRGHTPNELFQLEKKRFLPLDKKTGRNDPCLCGSGKKYKKCCGKTG